jgi:hypothetical protein
MARLWRIGFVGAIVGSAIVFIPASRSGRSIATAGAVRPPAPGPSPAQTATASPATLSIAAQRALDRSPAGLVETRLPDGSTSVDLQGRFQIGIAVRVGPHGPETKCIATEQAARRFFEQAERAPTEE